MGHADGSGTAIYNRYGYVKEMREVLERWTADLTASEFEPARMWSEPEMVRYVIVEPTEAAWWLRIAYSPSSACARRHGRTSPVFV